MAKTMKTLNGYEIVDDYARTQIEKNKNNITELSGQITDLTNISNVKDYSVQQDVDTERLVGENKTSRKKVVQTKDADSTIYVHGNESAVEHIRLGNTNGYLNKIGIDIGASTQRLTFNDIFIEHSPSYAIGVNIPTGYYSQFNSCWIQGDIGISIGDATNRDGWIGVLDFNACHFNNSDVAFLVNALDTNTICLDKCSFEGDKVSIDNYGKLYVRNTYFGDQLESTKAVMLSRAGSETYFDNCTIGLSAFANGGRTSIFDLSSDDTYGGSIVRVTGGELALSNNRNVANSISTFYNSDSDKNLIFIDFAKMRIPSQNNSHGRIPYYCYDGYTPLRSRFPLSNYVSNGLMKSTIGNDIILGQNSNLSFDSSMMNPFGGKVLKSKGTTKFFYKVPKHLVGEKMVLELFLYTPTADGFSVNSPNLGISGWGDTLHLYETERTPIMYRIEVTPTSETGTISLYSNKNYNVYGVILKKGEYKDMMSCYEDINEIYSDTVPTTTNANMGDVVYSIDTTLDMWKFNGENWLVDEPITYHLELNGGLIYLIGSDGSSSSVSVMKTFGVAYVLTHCSVSNSGTTAVEGGSYETIIAADADYELSSVTVTMDGEDITADTYDSSTGRVFIAGVTGAIKITAIASFTEKTKVLTDVACATRSAWDTTEEGYVGQLRLNPSNDSLALGVTTANDYAYTDRESNTVYVMPVPNWARNVTVDEATHTNALTYKVAMFNEVDGTLTKLSEQTGLTNNKFSFEAGSVTHIAITLINANGSSWAWGYDDSKTTVTFSNVG